MSEEEELKKLRKEIDDLRKNKIILQAKLKQKEDKITELSKKVSELSISAKESGDSKTLNSKVSELEDDVKRAKKQNDSLRNEIANLTTQLDIAKKASANTSGKTAPEPVALQKVSVPGSGSSEKAPSSQIQFDNEELSYMREQLTKKDSQISQLTEQLEGMSPQQLSEGSSYMKIRQLNAKIRELKGQLELAKKSEASMKERIIQIERTAASKEEELNW